MKYDVSVIKTSRDSVPVEADSIYEAEEKVEDLLRSGEYVFPENAEVEYEYEAAEEKPEKIRVLLLEPGEIAKVSEIGTSLEELQAVVGGFIETAYYFDDPVILVVNDEGKINGMSLNRGVYDKNKRLVDIIAGPAFLCRSAGDSFGSLTDEQIKKYSQIFKYPERFYRMNDEIKGVPIKPEKTPER